MASAEQLRIAHSIDSNVQGIDDEVKDVGARVQGVDRKLDDASRLSSLGPHGFSFQKLRLVPREPPPR